jgi:cell division protein FtsW
MAKKLSSDKWLFGITLALVFCGVVMVFSASAVLAEKRFDSAYYFLFRQGLWALLGIISMSGLMHLNYQHLRKPLLVFGGLFICAICLGAVLVVDKSHQTHRWIRLGFLSFQPSELSKFFLVLFLAYFLERQAGKINDWLHTLFPVMAVLLVFLGLVVIEPDLGTPITIATVALILLFCAGLAYRYVWVALLISIPAVIFFIHTSSYRMKRIMVFLDPWKDPLGAGFQVTQSLIAVGAGGVTGAGLMEGKQKLFYLPEPHNDFIFAVIGEELGLIGTLAILVLFGLFLWRGLRIALRAPDPFGQYLALGLTFMVFCQALINISVAISLLPTKGIPLPFISSGGSSLLISLLGVGVLLNISQHGR